MRVPEEGDAWSDRVDFETGVARGPQIRLAVGERKRDLFDRRRSGFADVIARDRNRIPLRHRARAIRHHVGNQAHRLARRIDVGAAGGVFFKHVVLHRAAERVERNAAASRDREVEREENRCRRVDRHRDGHFIERNPVEQNFHIGDRVDRDARFADFAARLRRVRIVAELGRQIEGDREAGLSAFEEIAVALVRFRGGRETGVLAHRPEPPAVHRRIDAACEWKRSRLAEVVRRPLNLVVNDYVILSGAAKRRSRRTRSRRTVVRHGVSPKCDAMYPIQ